MFSIWQVLGGLQVVGEKGDEIEILWGVAHEVGENGTEMDVLASGLQAVGEKGEEIEMEVFLGGGSWGGMLKYRGLWAEGVLGVLGVLCRRDFESDGSIG